MTGCYQVTVAIWADLVRVTASGLDFIGSGLDFGARGPGFWRLSEKPKIAEILPRSCRDSPRSGQATGCLPSIAELLWPLKIEPRSSEGGGAAVVPPQRVFNPPPTAGVPGVLDTKSTCPDLSQKANLDFFF